MTTTNRALEHLTRLVAFDTQNPPRRIDGGGLFAYCHEQLPGFDVEVKDLGQGCVFLYATRGTPDVLFNFHVDTVPKDARWTLDPHELLVTDQTAVGLGACDIKGALACFLAALPHTKRGCAVLLSSDEEAGSSTVIKTFLAERAASTPDDVVVAEPTRCEAIVAHRGIATATGTFTGIGGHASSPRALTDSALHEAVRWSHRVLEREPRLRFNLGVLEGGVKANMIASEAKVKFGMRPPPGTDPRDALEEVFNLAPDPARVAFEPGFLAPPLPAPRAGRSLDEAERAGMALAQRLGLDTGAPVDFFTEAAFFSAAGKTALVFGPGDIQQAHTADEWVALDQLTRALALYERMLA